jgi:two-component system LytT family response regulator
MFLDIQMPGLSGLDVVAQVPQESMPMVVFVTAFDRYAIKAFEAHALDYLLKPVDDGRLAAALERVRAQYQQQQAAAQREQLLALLADLQGKGEISPDVLAGTPAAGAAPTQRRYATMLPIRSGRETLRLDVATIDWIDAAGDYMCLHAAGQTHVLRATMKELEDMLDPGVFQRVHRSTIVNLARVRSLRPHLNGECFLKLQSGQEIKLSRSFRDKVEMLLDRSGIAPHASRA